MRIKKEWIIKKFLKFPWMNKNTKTKLFKMKTSTNILLKECTIKKRKECIKNYFIVLKN